MADLADGTYKVFLAGDVNLALDTTGASRGNGANVRVLSYDPDSDGMVFDVFRRGDGTYRILSRFSGKALDTDDTPVAGANVRQWTSRDTRDQCWDVADTGTTVQKWGRSYPAYEVSIARAEVLAHVDGESSVTLADATGRVESIAVTPQSGVVESISVGGEAIQLPTYLAALPSGIADRAIFDARGMTVERNVGRMTAFDPGDEEQVALAGDDFFSSTGALDAGATVYYAIPDQDDDIEQQAEDAELELDEGQPAAMASIESHPLSLPAVTAGAAVEAAGSYVEAAYWALEPIASALKLTAASAASKANVLVDTAGSAGLQRWLFTPVPTFETSAVYEIQSFANSKLVLAGNGTSNGSNVYMMGDDDSNSQRWIMVERAPGRWTLQNVASRRFLAVSGGVMANGRNVVQWDGTGGTAQDWHVTGYGTVTRDGKACPLVKLTAWGSDPENPSATHYNLDVNGASKAVTAKANVCIYQDDDSADQRWVLVRTYAVDGSIGVPDSLTATWGPGGTAASTSMGVYGGRHVFYPYWQAPDNWLATNSANNYQLRWRMRYMDSDTGKWGPWGEYTPWRTYPCTIIDRYADAKRRGKSGWAGEQAWMTQGIAVELALQDSEDASGRVVQGVKAAEVQFGVRCVGAGSKASVVGYAAYQTVRLSYAPDMSLVQAVWTPSGYQLMFRTDYDKGQWGVILDELTVNGRKVLSKPKTFDGLSGFYGTAFLDMDNVAGAIPGRGSDVRAKWRVRTDLGTFGKQFCGSIPLVWDANHSEQAAPAIARNGNTFIDTATVTHTAGAKVRMWARWVTPEGTRFRELPGKAGGTKTVFTVAAPLHAYQLWTTVRRSNDFWSTSFTVVPDAGGMKPHVWTSGASLLAKLAVKRGEPPMLDSTLEADADTVRLNKRPREAVRFGATKSQELSVTGTAYVRGADASGEALYGQSAAHPSGAGMPSLGSHVDTANLEALVGRHCTYRSPWGHVYDVAVTKVACKDMSEYLCEVTVSMTVEGS